MAAIDFPPRLDIARLPTPIRPLHRISERWGGATLWIKHDDDTGGPLSGNKIRVVSMPSTNVFDAQDEAYRESVLPSSVKARVAVEAGVTDGWIKYVGLEGKVIGINTFGESAPAGDLFKHFGFTTENVVKAVQAVL